MTYTVQPGDTPMLITQKMLGNPMRVNELIRMNPHKATVRVGNVVTFRQLTVGETLAIPPRWRGMGQGRTPSRPPKRKPKKPMNPRKPIRNPSLQGHAYPQPAPHPVVHPRDSNEGTEIGDDGGSEPILGLGKGPCCASCGSGGPCETGCPSVQMPPCSAPQAPPSIPGSTSFPVGFGQTPPAVTTSTVASALSGWGVPLAVGAISIAAGFGLAYVISHK